MLKIRCSALGKIMTNARAKSETLSETTKTYLKELKIEEIFGVSKDIESKYITKGLLQEDEGIELYLKATGEAFGIKNETHFDNEFITGTPDLILSDRVVDIKCPWDVFNIPFFDEEIKNKDYFYQLQGYMDLTGLKKAELAYTLVNTPLEVSYSELDYFNYDEIEIKNRIKIFSIDYDQSVIDDIYQRIIECRDYYARLVI